MTFGWTAAQSEEQKAREKMVKSDFMNGELGVQWISFFDPSSTHRKRHVGILGESSLGSELSAEFREYFSVRGIVDQVLHGPRISV